MTAFVRKNAWDANNGGQFLDASGNYTDLYWYAIGVQEMKSKPISDPTSWWFYAAIHGQYLTDYFGTGPAPTYYPNWTRINSIPAVAALSNLPSQNLIDLFWNQCQHGTWFFPPWHRGYLVALENILRAIIINANGPSDWAFPYWNYLNQSTSYSEYEIPPAFTATSLPDGSPNPLYVPERYGPKGDSNVYVPVGASMQGAAANDECQWDTNYADPKNPQGSPNNYGYFYGGQQTGFSHNNGGFGDLEMNPHNFVHGFVGGQLPGTALPNFTVLSTSPWQSTGITIGPNATVVISYSSGTWTADPQDDGGQLYDANGSPDIIVPASQPLYPIVNVPMGVLIGRVNGGLPFVVADGSVVPDNIAGLLELCINDDLTGAYGPGLTDNKGSITVSFVTTPSEEYEGLMADPGIAGLDPVFFLHHANIDRMWAAWNETGGNKNATDLNWLAGPQAQGNSQFAMPTDASGTPWYYTPAEVEDLANLTYFNGVQYLYTYDDLSLTSYDNTPPAKLHNTLAGRLAKLGATDPENAKNMSANNNNNSELVGASSTSIVLNSGITETVVKLDAGTWSSVVKSLRVASADAQPNDVFLKLENVTGTNNANFLSLYIHNQFVKTASLFGIRMASMKNGGHGGSGLTLTFNITDVIDDLFLANNVDANALNVQIKTENAIANGSQITIGRVSIYRLS
jgi:hypothetical protein